MHIFIEVLYLWWRRVSWNFKNVNLLLNINYQPGECDVGEYMILKRERPLRAATTIQINTTETTKLTPIYLLSSFKQRAKSNIFITPKNVVLMYSGTFQQLLKLNSIIKKMWGSGLVLCLHPKWYMSHRRALWQRNVFVFVCVWVWQIQHYISDYIFPSSFIMMFLLKEISLKASWCLHFPETMRLFHIVQYKLHGINLIMAWLKFSFFSTSRRRIAEWKLKNKSNGLHLGQLCDAYILCCACVCK